MPYDDLSFEYGKDVYLEVDTQINGVQTYNLDSFELMESGVFAEHATSGVAYRMFIPWCRVLQIWQAQ